MVLLRTVLASALLCSVCSGVNMAGILPRQYEDGAKVNLKVNRIDSIKTQLPYEYYSLPFCRPKEIVNSAETLGEVLRGDRPENSLYELNMNHNVDCKVLCHEKFTKGQLSQFADKVREEYRVHWIVDNLPAATRVPSTEGSLDGTDSYSYERGYPLGFMTGDGPFIHNHVSITIKYRTSVDQTYSGNRIVGFEVSPASVAHSFSDRDSHGVAVVASCPKEGVANSRPPQGLSGDAADIIFTYSVKWELSDTRWANRWDMYLKQTNDNVHWFSIINSLVMVLVFSFVVAFIVMRTLNTDIAMYNMDMDLEEDGLKEETGWKLVHGDVFRPPVCYNLLSVLLGTGCQLYACSFLVLTVACFGLLAPANRGALGTALLCFFAVSGIFAGFFGSSFYKMFKGTEWKMNVVLVSFLYPSICAGIFFFLNLFVWAQGSSAAIPFQHMLLMLFLWVGISVPLVAVGAYFGLRRKTIELPCQILQIPRLIPANPWIQYDWLVFILSCVLGGAACFIPVFIELFFIMSSVWLHHHHYLFGFLSLVFIILTITCAEVAIVLCYFQLASEDYHWWWRTFCSTGSSAVYLFFYSVYYFYHQLDLTNFVSVLLYFGYMWVTAFTFFILTGTIGLVACLVFTIKIYAEIKID